MRWKEMRVLGHEQTHALWGAMPGPDPCSFDGVRFGCEQCRVIVHDHYFVQPTDTTHTQDSTRHHQSAHPFHSTTARPLPPGASRVHKTSPTTRHTSTAHPAMSL